MSSLTSIRLRSHHICEFSTTRLRQTPFFSLFSLRQTAGTSFCNPIFAAADDKTDADAFSTASVSSYYDQSKLPFRLTRKLILLVITLMLMVIAAVVIGTYIAGTVFLRMKAQTFQNLPNVKSRL